MSRQSRVITLEMGSLKFTWDDAKADGNERNHGVTFEEAASCWLDPLNLEFDDPEHSIDEQRWLLMGTSKLNRLLICWFTERKFKGEEVIRIIGARKVTKSERERCEKDKRR